MPLKKTGGTVAALFLASVMVFGGGGVAHAADPLTLVPFDSSGAANAALVLHSMASAGAPVTVPELTAPSVGYTMGYATARAEATTAFEDTAIAMSLYSVTQPSGPGSGYVSSSAPVTECTPTSPADPSMPHVCVFSGLTPGIWRISTDQRLDESESPQQNDFFIIPASPTLAATQEGARGAAFSGTGVTGDLVSVIDETGATMCAAAVTAAQWRCTVAEATGSHSYRAFQSNPSWTPDTDGSGQVAGVELGTVPTGLSALTTAVPLTIVAPVPPPAMSYDFGNASVTITAAGDASGEGSSIEVYSVDTSSDDYSFTAYPGCIASGEGEGYYYGATIPTTQVCTLGDLTPGVWNVYSSQVVAGTSSPHANDYFRVPAAPTITARSLGPQQVRLQGSGTDGDIVTAREDGTPVCHATVVDSTWNCTITPTPGAHSYTASQLDQGFVVTDVEEATGTVYNARSAASAPASLTVAAVPAPPSAPPTTPSTVPPPTTQAGVPTLFFWVLNLVGGDVPLHAGDTVTASSSGLPPGALVSFELRSTPRDLGTTSVTPEGTFSRTIVIPDDVEPGDHHIVVTVTPQGEAASQQTAAITVVAAPPEAAAGSAAATSSADDESQAAPTRGSGDIRNTPTAPSSFTHALPTIAQLFDNPGTLAVAVGLAFAILLLAALPTEMLDSAVSSNLDRFGPFLARAGSWADRSAAWLDRVTHGQALSSAIMVVLSSIIFGFADPDYGFNLVSLRLTVSIIIALYIVYYIAPRISGAIIRTRWRVDSEISIQPIALVFAIVGVIVGRLLGFSPGFLIGLAIGLQLAATAKLHHKARAMAVQVAVIVGLALLAWVAYSLIALLLDGRTGSMWTSLVQEVLTAITAEGLTGMLLGLFPLTFFEGKEVWEHSKRLWSALFLVTGTAFALLVLPTAAAPEEIGESLPVWLLVLGCFTVFSLGLWLYLRRTTSGEDVDAAEAEQKVEA